jgi:hypothetical protein
MIYTSGYPKFSIEKPANSPYHPATVPMLRQRQNKGFYYGELKLNEARSFICIDDKGKATVYTYRHSEPTKIRGPALEKLEAMDLPPSTVLDGGHLYRTSFGESKLWIFDILIWAGREVGETAIRRRSILDEVIASDKTIWRPLWTEKWLKEFESMMAGKSRLMKKAALQYGVPLEELTTLIEGLVMKDRSHTHGYPRSMKEIGSMFKIRLSDLPDDLKPGFVK